jgi:hypothetical protein
MVTKPVTRKRRREPWHEAVCRACLAWQHDHHVEARKRAAGIRPAPSPELGRFVAAAERVRDGLYDSLSMSPAVPTAGRRKRDPLELAIVGRTADGADITVRDFVATLEAVTARVARWRTRGQQPVRPGRPTRKEDQRLWAELRRVADEFGLSPLVLRNYLTAPADVRHGLLIHCPLTKAELEYLCPKRLKDGLLEKKSRTLKARLLHKLQRHARRTSTPIKPAS